MLQRRMGLSRDFSVISVRSVAHGFFKMNKEVLI